MDESTKGYVEKFCTHVEFRTLPKGVPDPPVDVQVELGPQDGSLLVTWLPVTINSQSGKSNGVPVTGYVVYADGRKITEVDSPTGKEDPIRIDTTGMYFIALLLYRRSRLTGHVYYVGPSSQTGDS